MKPDNQQTENKVVWRVLVRVQIWFLVFQEELALGILWKVAGSGIKEIHSASLRLPKLFAVSSFYRSARRNHLWNLTFRNIWFAKMGVECDNCFKTNRYSRNLRRHKQNVDKKLSQVAPVFCATFWKDLRIFLEGTLFLQIWTEHSQPLLFFLTSIMDAAPNFWLMPKASILYQQNSYKEAMWTLKKSPVTNKLKEYHRNILNLSAGTENEIDWFLRIVRSEKRSEKIFG